MVLTPPPEFPDWAMLDQVDPTSHVNNVVTPPLEKQQFGWDRLEFPPRQWFNWLGRRVSNWIHYLSGNSPASTVRIFGTYGTSYVICDPTKQAIFMLYINDASTAGGQADRFFIGMCSVFSPTNSDRTVNIIANFQVTVSQINHLTGEITVSTTGGGDHFELVAVQYPPGV
jgi:hypothetical protein